MESVPRYERHVGLSGYEHMNKRNWFTVINFVVNLQRASCQPLAVLFPTQWHTLVIAK